MLITFANKNICLSLCVNKLDMYSAEFKKYVQQYEQTKQEIFKRKMKRSWVNLWLGRSLESLVKEDNKIINWSYEHTVNSYKKKIKTLERIIEILQDKNINEVLLTDDEYELITKKVKC